MFPGYPDTNNARSRPRLSRSVDLPETYRRDCPAPPPPTLECRLTPDRAACPSPPESVRKPPPRKTCTLVSPAHHPPRTLRRDGVRVCALSYKLARALGRPFPTSTPPSASQPAAPPPSNVARPSPLASPDHATRAETAASRPSPPLLAQHPAFPAPRARSRTYPVEPTPAPHSCPGVHPASVGPHPRTCPPRPHRERAGGLPRARTGARPAGDPRPGSRSPSTCARSRVCPRARTRPSRSPACCLLPSGDPPRRAASSVIPASAAASLSWLHPPSAPSPLLPPSPPPRPPPSGGPGPCASPAHAGSRAARRSGAEWGGASSATRPRGPPGRRALDKVRTPRPPRVARRRAVAPVPDPASSPRPQRIAI